MQAVPNHVMHPEHSTPVGTPARQVQMAEAETQTPRPGAKSPGLATSSAVHAALSPGGTSRSPGHLAATISRQDVTIEALPLSLTLTLHLPLTLTLHLLLTLHLQLTLTLTLMLKTIGLAALSQALELAFSSL